MASNGNARTLGLQRLIINVSSDEGNGDASEDNSENNGEDNSEHSSEDDSEESDEESDDASSSGSDEDDANNDDEDAQPEQQILRRLPPPMAPLNDLVLPVHNENFPIALEDIQIAEGLPNESMQGRYAVNIDPANVIASPVLNQNAPNFTAEQRMQASQRCLEQVLEVFPDISHTFVNEMFEKQVHLAAYLDISGDIIRRIADMEKYPTQRSHVAKEKEEQKALQAKLDSEARELSSTKQYQQLSLQLLKGCFPDITVAHIRTTMMQSSRLQDAYLVLSDASDHNLLTTQRLSKRRRESESQETLEDKFPQAMAALAQKELSAARLERQKRSEKRQAELAELHREREAQSNGQIAECGCCFCDDIPIWKMGQCSGDVPHLFCFECIRRLAESELGLNRCHPVCMDTSGCNAEFTENQLRVCLDEKILARLIRLQQQEDLKSAGIEGLEDCPFCEYRAVCCSPLIDREFRCQNEECMKVSCRLCQKETHVPLTCEQAAKEKSLGARHQLEEAMTDALVRACNKCKQRFIKTEGCNKMSCPSCDHKQCYVCHKSIVSYDHFGDKKSSKCPLYDHEGVDSRHIREVKAAEDKIKASITAENPDISSDELSIKVSDAIKRAEDAKQNEIAARRQQVPYHHHVARGRRRRVIPDAQFNFMLPEHVHPLQQQQAHAGYPPPMVYFPLAHGDQFRYPQQPPQWQPQLDEAREDQGQEQAQGPLEIPPGGLNITPAMSQAVARAFPDRAQRMGNVDPAAAIVPETHPDDQEGVHTQQNHQRPQPEQHPIRDQFRPEPGLGQPIGQPGYNQPTPIGHQVQLGANVYRGAMGFDQMYPAVFQVNPPMNQTWEQLQQRQRAMQQRQYAMQQQNYAMQQQHQAAQMMQNMHRQQQNTLMYQQQIQQQQAMRQHQAVAQQQAMQQQQGWQQFQQDLPETVPAVPQDDNVDNIGNNNNEHDDPAEHDDPEDDNVNDFINYE